MYDKPIPGHVLVAGFPSCPKRPDLAKIASFAKRKGFLLPSSSGTLTIPPSTKTSSRV